MGTVTHLQFFQYFCYWFFSCCIIRTLTHTHTLTNTHTHWGHSEPFARCIISSVVSYGAIRAWNTRADLEATEASAMQEEDQAAEIWRHGNKLDLIHYWWLPNGDSPRLIQEKVFLSLGFYCMRGASVGLVWLRPHNPGSLKIPHFNQADGWIEHWIRLPSQCFTPTRPVTRCWETTAPPSPPTPNQKNQGFNEPCLFQVHLICSS